MTTNASWQLEDFVDSLVVELDKTRETLAVKAINKPLSYSVKEVALDLNIFPSYDGENVSFVTAQPGQEGASTVTIQLGSITDQQVRATTKVPAAGGTPIEQTDLDRTTQTKLRRLGVSSIDDLEQIERKNVDLRQVSDNEIDYGKLANQIRKARRDTTPPRVQAVSLTRDVGGAPCLVVRGEHLAVDPVFTPVAVLNRQLVEVLSAQPDELRLALAPSALEPGADHELVLTFDPFAVMKVNVRG